MNNAHLTVKSVILKINPVIPTLYFALTSHILARRHTDTHKSPYHTFRNIIHLIKK